MEHLGNLSKIEKADLLLSDPMYLFYFLSGTIRKHLIKY